MAGESSWRNRLLQNLRSRNERQTDGFITLIQAHNKLLESAEKHHSSSIQLTVEVEKLKQENLELRVKGDAGGNSGGGGGGGKTEKILEQKVLRLHEELTELHRKRGENAQNIIDLNNTLQEKEKELQAKEVKIMELVNTIEGLRDANRSLEQNLLEATTANQVLTDEQQALQLAYTGLEKKFRDINDEHNQLVRRWLELRASDADRINADNDKAFAAKQVLVKKELEDASKEPLIVKELPGFDGLQPPPVVVNVTVPSRAMSVFDAHEGEVNAIRWAPSGRLFATGGTDRKLKLWEVLNGKCESKGLLTGSNAAIMSVEFDAEEHFVLASSNDFASRVWSISDQRLRHTLTGHSGKVLAAKFLGDPNQVVSGSYDRTLKLWDLRSRVCKKTIFAGSSCNDLVTSHGLGSIISGHFDKKIRFWDTRSDSSSNEILLQGRITSLDISPDRTTLLSCTRDDTIKLVDLRMNQVCRSLSDDNFRVGSDWSRAVFSPDGDYVLCGSSDGNLYIWNSLNGKVEKILKQHSHCVMACSWSPSGSSLLSCDKHRSAVLWADF